MAFEKTQVAARGRWKGLLLHFGMDEKFLKDEHGPCPMCGGKDRYRWDDRDGTGSYYCSQCGAGSGMHLLMELRGWDFPKAAKEIDQVLGIIQQNDVKAGRTEDEKRAYMKKLYRESRPVTPGDPVHIYLTRRCGDPAGLLDDLRFHPDLKHSVARTSHPAMLAMMGWDGKKFSGIHRTYLTPDGNKADVDPVRMSYGELGAVRLGGVQERLGIAEGIETALCASRLFQVPVWAATCANALLAWEPPEGVTEVVVFADNDENYVGQAAAFDLAKKLRGRGLKADVRIPPVAGTDWADVWASGPDSGVA